MKRSLFVILIITALSLSTQAKYSGGSGTTEAPYQIANATDLLALAADTNDYDANFILTADIDLDPNLPGNQTFITAVIAPGVIYSTVISFEGDFNGNSHTISNLTINGGGAESYFFGLFGYAAGGTIKNLRLENVNIIGGNGSSFIGGLTGYNGSTISNCYSSGTINGGDNSSNLGGLAGYNGGTIISCYSSGTISSGDNSSCLGGLAGINSGGIGNCSSTGNVIGDINSTDIGGLAGFNTGSIYSCSSTGIVKSASDSESIGGLVGHAYYVNWNSTINHCHSTSNIISSDHCKYIGGLVGYNEHYSGINNCYSSGDVNSGNDSCDTGGLAGCNDNAHIRYCYSTGNIIGGVNSVSLGGLVGTNNIESDIRNCYSTGNVNGEVNSIRLGGLAGYNNYGEISNCYSTGEINGMSDSDTLGGLVGYNEGYIDNSYFLDSSGPDNGPEIPLTDAQMKQRTSFVGWDFIDVWQISDGVNYPQLQYISYRYFLYVLKCNVTSGKKDYSDKISFSGVMDANADDFNNTTIIEVTIDSNDRIRPCIQTFPIDSNTFKKGKYNYSKTVNGVKKLFTYDVKTGKFSFSVHNVNLDGFDCPLIVRIKVGDWSGRYKVDEAIVNGKKPIPINFLMGVKNSLRVDKSKFTHNKKTGNITGFSISGGFSVKNVNDTNLVTNSLSVVLGQTFTIPAGSFKASKGKFTCSNVKLYDFPSNLINVAAATFDFNKCTFTLTIKNTNLADGAGAAYFNMEFGDFSESVEVLLRP